MIHSGGRVTPSTLAFERRPKGCGMLGCVAPTCRRVSTRSRSRSIRASGGWYVAQMRHSDRIAQLSFPQDWQDQSGSSLEVEPEGTMSSKPAEGAGRDIAEATPRR
eukprot:2265295-Prorocentrum_lima.AAC.1